MLKTKEKKLKEGTTNATKNLGIYFHIEVKHHKAVPILFQFRQPFRQHFVEFLNKLRQRIHRERIR